MLHIRRLCLFFLLLLVPQANWAEDNKKTYAKYAGAKVLPIYTYGSSVLSKKAKDVKLNKRKIERLTRDMFLTMDSADGTGLAAPQVGRSIRVVVIDLDWRSAKEPQYKGFRHAFINGRVLDASVECDTLMEGCLSLPKMSAPVIRPKRVRVSYYDENLNYHDEWLDGYLARVVQHEFDHLDGLLYIDRVERSYFLDMQKDLDACLRGEMGADYKVKRPIRSSKKQR